MAREVNKTQTMRNVFAAVLAGFTVAQLQADRGRAFRAQVLEGFLAEHPDKPDVAPVLYNVVRKEVLEAGTIQPGVIGRRPKDAPEVDLTLPWAITEDGTIVNTFPGRAAARAAKADGQRVQKTAEVLA